ncbi:MAG: MFS transporter, partial [Glutamicibacter arilaitensis]
VPAIKHAAEGISLRKELGAFTSLQVWLSLAITVLGYGGMFGAFTYIAYTLTEVTGFNETSVPWLLMLFGIGLFAGNWIGGRMADKSIDRTLLFFIAALLAVLIAFAALASNPVATMVALFLMGGFGFGTVPGLQSRIMQFAGSAPTLASGANIGAFNLGNALGAWAGGLGIAAGLGYTSPIWIGAAITVAALLVVLVAMSLAKKSAKTPELVPAC